VVLPGGKSSVSWHLMTEHEDWGRRFNQDWGRRHKLNVSAIGKHGTLDFKHPRMSTCADEVREQSHTTWPAAPMGCQLRTC
jgi:hypothetical protein